VKVTDGRTNKRRKKPVDRTPSAKPGVQLAKNKVIEINVIQAIIKKYLAKNQYCRKCTFIKIYIQKKPLGVEIILKLI